MAPHADRSVAPRSECFNAVAAEIEDLERLDREGAHAAEITLYRARLAEARDRLPR